MADKWDNFDEDEFEAFTEKRADQFSFIKNLFRKKRVNPLGDHSGDAHSRQIDTEDHDEFSQSSKGKSFSDRFPMLPKNRMIFLFEILCLVCIFTFSLEPHFYMNSLKSAFPNSVKKKVVNDNFKKMQLTNIVLNSLKLTSRYLDYKSVKSYEPHIDLNATKQDIDRLTKSTDQKISLASANEIMDAWGDLKLQISQEKDVIHPVNEVMNLISVATKSIRKTKNLKTVDSDTVNYHINSLANGFSDELLMESGILKVQFKYFLMTKERSSFKVANNLIRSINKKIKDTTNVDLKNSWKSLGNTYISFYGRYKDGFVPNHELANLDNFHNDFSNKLTQYYPRSIPQEYINLEIKSESLASKILNYENDLIMIAMFLLMVFLVLWINRTIKHFQNAGNLKNSQSNSKAVSRIKEMAPDFLITAVGDFFNSKIFNFIDKYTKISSKWPQYLTLSGSLAFTVILLNFLNSENERLIAACTLAVTMLILFTKRTHNEFNKKSNNEFNSLPHTEKDLSDVKGVSNIDWTTQITGVYEKLELPSKSTTPSENYQDQNENVMKLDSGKLSGDSSGQVSAAGLLLTLSPLVRNSHQQLEIFSTVLDAIVNRSDEIEDKSKKLLPKSEASTERGRLRTLAGDPEQKNPNVYLHKLMTKLKALTVNLSIDANKNDQEKVIDISKQILMIAGQLENSIPSDSAFNMMAQKPNTSIPTDINREILMKLLNAKSALCQNTRSLEGPLLILQNNLREISKCLTQISGIDIDAQDSETNIKPDSKKSVA